MFCKSACLANSFDVPQLNYALSNKEISLTNNIIVNSSKFRNVVYIKFAHAECYIFSYGCIVTWNLAEQEIKNLVNKIKKYAHEISNSANSDYYNLVISDHIKIYQNEIYITEDASSMQKLALSYAMAQSMKLAEFEERVEETIKKTEYIPKSLAKTGKITLSGKQIAQKIGSLFIERSSINLHTDILDKPDFLWNHSELEPLYIMVAKDQDIRQRVDILNKRLILVHELFEMLSDFYNTRHSSLLEIIIIFLISIEIILTIGFKILH